MPRYYKRFWDESRGDSRDDWGTSTWYFEVSDDRKASRQIEVYENGNVLKYDDELVFDDFGGLADPPFDEEEYSDVEISADHFERVWSSTKPFNRRRWHMRSALLSGPWKRAARRVVTIVFGALPATALFLYSLSLLYFELMGILDRIGLLGALDQTFELLLGLGWTVLAALGTFGIWRVAVQRRFVSRKNFYLLTAGLLAIWPPVLGSLALWSESPQFHELVGIWLGLAFLLGAPVLIAFAYLVAMVILHARGRDA